MPACFLNLRTYFLRVVLLTKQIALSVSVGNTPEYSIDRAFYQHRAIRAFIQKAQNRASDRFNGVILYEQQDRININNYVDIDHLRHNSKCEYLQYIICSFVHLYAHIHTSLSHS